MSGERRNGNDLLVLAVVPDYPKARIRAMSLRPKNYRFIGGDDRL